MDRISNLPNEIICHIVSFLTAKEAAFAKLLSKKWQNIYTIISKLEFADKIKFEGTLKDFLDQVQALPHSSRVRKITLNFFKNGAIDPAHYSEVNSGICNVLKRGVMELELELGAWVPKEYSLPYEIFTCKTLVKLKLGAHMKMDHLPENALLPALKTLIITEAALFYDSCGCAFQKLLSACPALVELELNNVQWEFWEWSRTVSSPTLQRLTINHKYFFSFIGSIEYDMESITFDTPRLTYFKYFDFAPRSYPIVNLGSLVEATLGVRLADRMGQYVGADNTITRDITNLIKGLRNVEILDLNEDFMKTLSFFHEAIPVFENLHRLSVPTELKRCWRTLAYLLNKSPNLKTLFLEGPLHYKPPPEDYDSDDPNYESDEPEDYGSDDDDDEVSDDDDLICECLSEYSFLVSCPVKVLEITEYSGTSRELEHMRHFLEKLSCLELVKLRSREADVSEQLKLSNYVLYLPRSSKCNIELEFVPPRFPQQSVPSSSFLSFPPSYSI